MRLRYLLVAASVLALVGSGLAQDCAEWNSSTFFRSATPEMVSACLEAGAEVGARNPVGMTPLHFAAMRSAHPAVITILVEAGARVAAREVTGRTPLHIAAQANDSLPIIEALLEAGSWVNAQDENGWTPPTLCGYWQ